MTSAFKIHDTVLIVSNEVKRLVSRKTAVRDETKLLSELVLCILSSQEKYEIAVSATRSLLRGRILRVPRNESDLEQISIDVRAKLREPMRFNISGKNYERRLRFNNQKANYILSTIKNIYLSDLTLGKILDTNETPLQTRRTLIRHAHGIGPKQASMFLRNVGFCSDFAVLDKHVISYMRIMAIDDSDKNPTNIRTYEAAESGLRSYAAAYDVDMLHLDIAIWTTMRTLRGHLI